MSPTTILAYCLERVSRPQYKEEKHRQRLMDYRDGREHKEIKVAGVCRKESLKGESFAHEKYAEYS